MSQRPNILFVTGTDTGVGKTFVGTSLARELRSRRIEFDVLKPVETGCKRTEQGVLTADDAMRLWEAGWKKREAEQVTLFRYETPAAPLVASREEGLRIEPAQLIAEIRARAADTPLLIVEGAGGLLVPISESFTVCDLLCNLEATALLVVGSRLGAINHTLLSLEALKRREVEVLAYVLNHPRTPSSADEWARKTNWAILRELAGSYGTSRGLEVEYVANDPARGQEREPFGISDLANAVIEHFALNR